MAGLIKEYKIYMGMLFDISNLVIAESRKGTLPCNMRDKDVV